MLNTLFSHRPIVHSQRPHHCVKQSGATSKSLLVAVVAAGQMTVVMRLAAAVVPVEYQRLLLILGYCQAL
jgi:hypothetical protein